jgi:hypothetical protein
MSSRDELITRAEETASAAQYRVIGVIAIIEMVRVADNKLLTKFQITTSSINFGPVDSLKLLGIGYHRTYRYDFVSYHE